jgi:hypothetical protein
MAAWLLVRDALGVKSIDRKNKVVAIDAPADLPLDWCEGVVPLPDGKSAKVSWRRGPDGAVHADVILPDGWN